VRALEAETERLRMASPAASTPSEDSESTKGLTRACPDGPRNVLGSDLFWARERFWARHANFAP
jgi:hypothetical protein